MENKKDLPLRVIYPEKRKEFEKELDSSLKAVQSAYDSIRAMEDLDKVPQDPKSITPKWLNEVLLEKVGGIEDLPMPVAKKKEILDMWEELRKQVRQHITTIQGFFENYDSVEYEVNDGIIMVTNKNEILDAASMIIVPQDAQKHYELWCGVLDAVKELRTWERERNLKKFPLTDIIRNDYSPIDPDNFALQWCCGTFTKNKYESALRAEQERATYEKLYL